MTGWQPTQMSCRKCGAQLWAYYDNGVISHYEFRAPLEGCCCEKEEKTMPKYEVKTTWSGYSRGTSTYIVEAESEEEAKELFCMGERKQHVVVRDDTENEIESVKQL